MRVEAFVLSLSVIGLMIYTPASAAPKVGAPAPSFEVRTMDGRVITLASQHGKVVILTFWATWCAPCREEMAVFQTYYEKHHDDGLEIIAVNQDDPDNAKTVARLMTSFTYSGAFDKQASYDRYGRVAELPVSVVIDRDGILRADSRRGPWVFDATRLETIVTPLLAAQP